jgi:hypothetical protein
MYEGKLGVKKLTSQYNISLQIKEKIQKEGIEFDQIMQLPDIHFSSTWNIFNENGVNVAEGLREIGKSLF